MADAGSSFKPSADDAVLIVVDLQEQLLASYERANAAGLVNRAALAIRACAEMKLPVLLAEQYPKGLGPTAAPIAEALPENVGPIEKNTFSCFGCPAFLNALDEQKRKTVILVGIETHVCVQQTAFDAMDRGLRVILLADAAGSRIPRDHQMALDLMRAKDVWVTTVESMLFTMLRSSKHPAFKTVSKLLRLKEV